MMNSFIKANTLGAGANGARTENGAISYNTFGTALLDQFGKAGVYRGRNINDVWSDQNILWSENPEFALKFPFYLRMITRQSNVIGHGKTEKVQRGAGARDEAFKRLLWIAKYHPEEFYRNLWLLPVVGSWKDLWVLLSFDGANEYLNEHKFFEVIAEGINDPSHKDLVKKYMPRIRSSKKCTTSWAIKTNTLAKRFADVAGWSYKDYRTYKASGEAHTFQKIICKGLYSNIDWKTIPGKALLNLVSGKFLTNHNLEDTYYDWIKSQPVAKFNGYAFELGRKLGNSKYEFNKTSRVTRITVDKQFNPSTSYYNRVSKETNYETAMIKLRSVFPSEFVNNFKIIWWYCSNRKTSDFPSTMEHGGTYMMSGFDGSIISFLLGGDMTTQTTNNKMPSMEDIIQTAFNQEVLTLIV